MLGRILNEKQERILREERQLLTDLRVALAKFDIASADQATLERSIRQLDELFLLVVVGEFNAGKSAFINALLGQQVLEEGLTPTTTRVHLLKYGAAITKTVEEAAVDVLTAPVELLQEINIVDTPGTNAIYREHEAITQEFVPRSDMVLFVTSADRPFTESERQFLEQIRGWGKKVLIVVNKIDILEKQEDVAQIEAFVVENARALLGVTPQVFPVSARQALRAKLNHDAALQAASRFDGLERAILATLDEEERIRLKFHNPMGVGKRLITDTLQVIASRLQLLEGDFETITAIDRQLAAYREDVMRDFHYRLADVDNALHEFENRGMAYFDETMRLARIFDLLDKSRLQADFEREVVMDVPQLTAQRVSEVIDWLVSSNLHQWEAVMGHLAQRRTDHTDKIVGQVGGSFDYNRDHLLETVGRAAQEAIDTYDQSAEASQIAGAVQNAVTETALVEVGAIGLGALLTALFSTTTLDLTGIFAAGTLAVLGLFVIPSRRREVKQELRIKIATMREELVTTLTEQFERELDRSLKRIDEAIAPYTRFVRTERAYLLETQTELARVRDGLARLEAETEDF